MTPKINTVAPKHRSSWFSPAQCLSYYKKPYKIREIQIHWWGDPKTKPSHDGVVNYIANKTGGSVNYVASGGRVTKMIPEKDCAITTQDGNPHGIKIECSPFGTDKDYETFGWLVTDIRKRYGEIPLVPHNKYWNTACPGTLSLDRINKEADKFKEDEMLTNRAHFITMYEQTRGKKPSEATINSYVGKKTYAYTWGKLHGEVINLPKLVSENAKLKTDLTACQAGTGVNKTSVIKYVQEKLT